MSVSITFARGARRVTGSNFLVTVGKTRILIDCGLSQGEKFSELPNDEKFIYAPSEVDALFFTHAHADHIGLFPRLVREGFKGKAYATAPTKALMPVMLEDSLSLMRHEAAERGVPPLFTEDDLSRALPLVSELAYHERVEVSPDVSVTLYNAGHILGSATVLIEAEGKKILFTGDLGRVPATLVPDREIPGPVDVLVTESVYGNRVHGSFDESSALLLDEVKGTAEKKGTLLIPAFSLERTQIILSILDKAMTDGVIPKVPVFLDSPLAAKVTDIYRRFPEFLREDVRARLLKGDDPFSFSSLSVTHNVSESEAVDSAPSPKVIMAGAGMSHGGRIRHHEAVYLPDPKTQILIVGYQVPGSLGRRILDGEKHVQIDGRHVKVKARVRSADGFSAHADRNDLLEFAEKNAPKRVFVVLGETEGASFLAQRISGFMGVETIVPREGETYPL